jgi:putative tricarboxylic transport membrane protein
MMSDGNVIEILDRPWALFFLVLCIATLAWPAVAERIGRRNRGAS